MLRGYRNVILLQRMCKWFKNKQTPIDELIGCWTKEDDGSGLLGIWGWSITFNGNETGVFCDWYSNRAENSDLPFVWKRIDVTSIRIETNDTPEGDTIVYSITKVTGAYGGRYLKLTGTQITTLVNTAEDEGFWISPEPLFKKC